MKQVFGEIYEVSRTSFLKFKLKWQWTQDFSCDILAQTDPTLSTGFSLFAGGVISNEIFLMAILHWKQGLQVMW